MDGQSRGNIDTQLYDRLTEVLPKDRTFVFHHVSTPPTKCDPLFAPPSNRKPERTFCETHFFTASVIANTPGASQPILVFAIELLVYTTRRLTTIFVSKADSTGSLGILELPQNTTSSPIRSIASLFIAWLAETRQRKGIKLVVSLFARSQSQYLFPNSVNNSGKHVLDDRQLIRWWCKTLDPVLRTIVTESTPEDATLGSAGSTSTNAYVIVPGFDKQETTSFFPPRWRPDPIDKRKWAFGHPLREIAPYPAAPPRCLIPRFPDDPKARYLTELDDELPDTSSSQPLASPSKKGTGMWKSIRTLEQFWEMMAFRQECSSGRMVGFIWLTFAPVTANGPCDESIDSQTSVLSPSASPPSKEDLSKEDLDSAHGRRNRKQRPRAPLTGIIVPRKPKVKTTTSNDHDNPSDKAFWPASGRGQVVLEQRLYSRVHDLLLRLDFSSDTIAADSSRKYIEEVRAIAGDSSAWGRIVIGRHEDVQQPSVGSSTSVNDMSANLGRKKREPEAEAINVLSSSMVRKKPKT